MKNYFNLPTVKDTNLFPAYIGKYANFQGGDISTLNKEIERLEQLAETAGTFEAAIYKEIAELERLETKLILEYTV